MFKERFKNSVVALLGGNSGIGRATASAFTGEGAIVSKADVAFTADYCDLSEFHCDVTSENDIIRWLEEIERVYGKIDVLVNCAGVVARGAAHTIEESDWQRVFDINTKGTFLSTKIALRLMLKQQSGGSIINIASQAGVRVERDMAHYSASKAAIIQFTKSVALEYAPKVRCNSVSPGLVDTELMRNSMKLFAEKSGRSYDEVLHERTSSIPMQRLQSAESIAEGVLYLASEAASDITGVNLDISGGELIPR